MIDAIKPLLESGLINEDIGQQLNEAWESKLNEAREQVRAELREEFAQRYEHDRNVMVEALDKMVTDGLQSEIEEFNELKQLIPQSIRHRYLVRISHDETDAILSTGRMVGRAGWLCFRIDAPKVGAREKFRAGRDAAGA